MATQKPEKEEHVGEVSDGDIEMVGDDSEVVVSAEDLAAQEAAFGDSFNDGAKPEASKPAKEPKPEPAPSADGTPPADKQPEQIEQPPQQEPVKDAAQQPAAPSPAPAPAAAPAAFDSQAEIRKVYGRLGALQDQLQTLLKPREVEGKPATLTAPELKRMKAEYPELAKELEGDLTDLLQTLAAGAKGPDPANLSELIEAGVQRRLAERADAEVTDEHPTWKADMWVDGKLGEARTPDYTAWLATMPEADRYRFENSNNPMYVTRRIGEFYTWRQARTQAQTEKQDRLKAAITPRGVPRAGPSTQSDREAAEAGFNEGFNS